jgi:LacI family transcriptional regulator
MRPLEPPALMPTRKRVTIKDVAREAGVSAQTVSRVLNDRPDVSAETYQRIRSIIEETGYSPNLVARSLTQGRSHVLGVVAYWLEYFGPSRILTGIDRMAAELGYSITLNVIHEPETRHVAPLLAGLVGRRVDGVIWAIPPVGDNRAWTHDEALDPAVPMILVGGQDVDTTLPSISIDNREIGRLATAHLLAGGCRRVAIVTGPLDWWEARERLAGWQEIVGAAGVAADDGLVVNGDWTPESGRRALEALLDRGEPIDAVFASNDQMALGVQHAAHVHGIRIPDDLSIVGVDDIAESSHYWPPLTTVLQPLQDVGALAVDTMARLLRQPGRGQDPAPVIPPNTMLRPRLVVRQSSRAR